jgi:gluconate 2-dehydrogenase gamma chain
MSKHDESRRAFLVGTVVGAGAVASGASLVTDAQAQSHPQARAGADAAHSSSGKLGTFLNQDDAAAVEAFTERLMPGAPGKPGARDAGVLNYIDLALAGAYSDLQDFYRRGCSALEAYCQQNHKKSFAQLTAGQQDEVIKAMEEGKAAGFTWPSAQAFFNTLRTHTIEGMFADPAYGGNKDFAGWRLVGFPGAQPAFTTADMQSRGPFTRAPMTGLQAKASARRG